METQRALTISEVCARASASRTAVYEAIKAGDLVARKRGRRTLVLAEDVSAWLNRLPKRPVNSRA
jgi:excisionase family DNA binding protein